MKPRSPVADFRPLERIKSRSLAEILAEVGFFSPHADHRQGTSALTLRADVTMRDLCETVTARLRAVRGVLAMIEQDEETPLHVTQAAEAALMLATEAAGFHEVLFQGVLLYRCGGQFSPGERTSS